MFNPPVVNSYYSRSIVKGIIMKKIFLTLLILLSIPAAGFAEVILAPQWTEFCPASYTNAQPSKLNSSKTYWYNRRLQFEDSISQCGSYTGEDLKSCYSQVRSAELSKNKVWNEKIQAEEESWARLQEYNNTQSTFRTINNLIDKIK